jgi:N-acetylmuramoyl-L-alanine amidase
VAAGPGPLPPHHNDPNPRGPDWDDPHPTLEQLERADKHSWLYGLPPEPIIQIGSPNFTPTRLGYKVIGVVIHTTVGTLADTDAIFQNTLRQTSAQYAIDISSALIHQYVAEANIAWQCGVFYPSAASPLANANTIGMEHVDNGNYNSPRPDVLYQTSSDLLMDICHRYANISCPLCGTNHPNGIPIDRVHIRKHSEIVATGCPDTLDIERIVAMANGTWIQPRTGEEDMLYVGPFHKLASPVTFTTFAAGYDYPDPDPVAAMASAVALNASIQFDGYCYSSGVVICTDLDGHGTQGPDWCWWHATSGQWVPDAILVTTSLTPTPTATIPAGEKLAVYPVSLDQIALAIDAGVKAAVAALPPPGLNKTQVDQEILTALGNLPAGAPHHHGVLGIINTGPVIPG